MYKRGPWRNTPINRVTFFGMLLEGLVIGEGRGDGWEVPEVHYLP